MRSVTPGAPARLCGPSEREEGVLLPVRGWPVQASGVPARSERVDCAWLRGWPVQASLPSPNMPTATVGIVVPADSAGANNAPLATAFFLLPEKRRENMPVGTRENDPLFPRLLSTRGS
eukprot:3787849-Rhodomonas_salina.2